MKKILIIAIVIIAGTAICTYFFIPKKLKVSSALIFQSNREGVARYLIADSNWIKWWPGKIIKTDTGKIIFQYDDYDFTITKPRYHSFELNLTKENNSYTSLLKIVSFKKDSIGLELETALSTGLSPINKIYTYYQAKKIKKCFDAILQALKKNTDSVKEVYGFDIKEEKVQMQHLVFTNKVFPKYPSTKDIYSIIAALREYISRYNAKEEFYPMLNIETSDSVTYNVRVGLPVNKKLPEQANISSKMMVKNGNILTTEVKGDINNINTAIKQMEKYILDYQRSIIAIPFQSLIIDRSKEVDSTRWVTIIYYPVV
jgi:hypothetical protein